MYSDKKITKEDTWRSADLMRHLQGQDKRSQRRERSKREEAERTHRAGESTERTQQDPGRETYRERERTRERTHLKEPEREEDSRRKETREKEKRKERERDRHKGGEQLRRERGADGDEKENKDREREEYRRYRELEREKDSSQKERFRDKDRERERRRAGRGKEQKIEKEIRKEKEGGRDVEDPHREKNKEQERERGERLRDIEYSRERERRERHRDTEHPRERERGERHRETEYPRERERRERHRETEYPRERERGERHRETEYPRERERGERHRETEYPRERERGERHRETEYPRERERGERHRETEYPRAQEDWRERERRQKPGHSQLSGPVDRDGRRERKKREKEHQETGESVGDLRDDQATQGGEERQKHKAKRHEGSNNRSDQRHQSPDSSHSTRGQEANDEVAVGDMRNEDYEEDFEDYEEDFEDVDEDEGKLEEEDENKERDWRELSPQRREEIKAIQRAMEEENKRASSAHSQSPTKEAESPKMSAQTERRPAVVRTHGKMIDFTAARQREVSQHALRRQQKRSAELLRLVDLDFSVTESLLDLPPVSEYDMYIKSFGMSNTKQVYVQCNEDNTERDTQTEEPDTREKWTQHPPESTVVCGGPKVSQHAPESVGWMTVDSKRLASFLHSAAQVMAVLLEENRTDSDSVKALHSNSDSLSFSDGSLQLNTKLPFLQGRQVTLLHFSQVQVHSLLSVHSPRSSHRGDTLDTHTLLCVWNIWEPSAPQRILICEAELRSCSFSPGHLSLVFAGTAVGSVLLWDLREHSCSHMHVRVDPEEWTLRYPTFSTDAVLSGAGHFSAVVSVEPILLTMEAELRGPLLADQSHKALDQSFQLASLDENGLLIFWVVVELPKADDSGSQTDLGLWPGGKVKLLHSSSLQTCDSSTSRGLAEVTGITGGVPHLSLLLRFLPSDSNHYFIGTSMGQVRRGTRQGLPVVPKIYTPEGERLAPVTVLHFCPNREPFFLVGCSDGTVRLHSLERAEPVCEWRVGSVPVWSVYWCPTRPMVFCALDASSVMHMWDLAEREDRPISSEGLHPDRVTGMAGLVVVRGAARQSSCSGFALARQSGRLEIHFLKQSRTHLRTSDPETLHALTHNMFETLHAPF